MPKRNFTIVEVWCEWDIGQGGLIFKDAHIAERWLRDNAVLRLMAAEDAKDFDEYYQELVDNCLIGIENLELIE